MNLACFSAYAAACRPVAVSAISTPPDGLECEDIQVSSNGFALPVFSARKARSKTLATLLVVQEVFGVHEHIRDVCRRLAHVGYWALAPELYARQGPVSHIEDLQDVIQKVVRWVSDSQVLADLDAVLAWAADSGRADPQRLGITGFCWGGRITWLYAARQPRLKAGVAWYGRLSAPPYGSAERTPRQPLDVAPEVHVPVLGLYGGLDESIPIEQVDRMRSLLSSPSEIVVYTEAGHAFFADYRPSYHAESAVDGWKRMLAWFARHGLQP